MESAAAVQSRLIGAILVENGLITAGQLEHALQLQEQSGDRLGEVVIAHFGVSRMDLASVLAEQWVALREGSPPLPEIAETLDSFPPPEAEEQSVAVRDANGRPRRPLGEIFVERGLITNEQLDQALATQWEHGGRIGDILLAQGAIRRLDLADALAEQWSLLQVLRGPGSASVPTPVPSGTMSSERWAAFERAFEEVDERLRSIERAMPSSAEADLARLEADLRSEVAATAGRIEELRALVEDDRRDARAVDGALEAVKEAVTQLQAESARPAASEAVTARLDALSGRWDALDEEVGRLRRLAEQSDPSGIASDIAELKHDFDRREQTLAQHTASLVGPLEEQVDQIRRRVDELSGRVDEAGGGVDASFAELWSAVGRLESGAEGAAAGVAERVGALEGVVESLGERVSCGPDRGEVMELVRRVDELSGRVDEAGGGVDASFAELWSAVGRLESGAEGAAAGVAERVGALEGVVESLSTSFVSAEALTDVSNRLEDLGRQVEQVAADAAAGGGLEQDVTSMRAAVDALAALVASRQSEVDQARVDALTARIEEIDAVLADRVEALGAAVDALVLGSAERGEVAALAKRIDDADHVVAGLVDDVAVARTHGLGLEAMLAELQESGRAHGEAQRSLMDAVQAGLQDIRTLGGIVEALVATAPAPHGDGAEEPADSAVDDMSPPKKRKRDATRHKGGSAARTRGTGTKDASRRGQDDGTSKRASERKRKRKHKHKKK